MSDVDALRTVTAFADLDDDALGWLADHARFVTLEPGEALFHEGESTPWMFAVLEGEFRSRREKGPPDGRVIVRRPGDIGGLLPHSRMRTAPSTGRATVRTRLACFTGDQFPEMLERIPVLRSRFTTMMVDRSRTYAREDEQRARLASVGRLAAGLAHELNNPAAAMLRSADALGTRLRALSAGAASALERKASAEQLAPLRELAARAARDPSAPLDALARGEAEEGVAAILDARGVSDPWSAAEAFVSAGIDAAALASATATVPPEALPDALAWLEADLDARQLLAELGGAARRVSTLIDAVKAYADMDRAAIREDVDLHEGIQATLVVLEPKLREKRVSLSTQFAAGVPPVVASPAELNQVWTQLLENALDAVPPGGTVTVRTRGTPYEAVVEIVDDGPGIPEELRGRVFEPFVTTKEVGAGSGLGLDMVRRILEAHRADVRLDSVPGRTCVEVHFRAAAPPTDADEA